jgi:ACDE family multidrug resistance protein
VTDRPPLVFIFTVTLTGILANTLVTPAIPDILAEFDAPASGAGWLVATGSMAGVVVAPIIGILADRVGRRTVLTTCLTVFGIFGGLAALAPSFEILLIARVLQGMGAAGLINLAVVLIGDNWSGAERTRLIGRNTAVLTVGLAGLPLLSGVVTEVTNWRVTFGIFTVALFTAAAAWTILDPHRPPYAPRVSDQVKNAALVLRQPILIATLSAGFVVFVIIFGLFLTVVPVHLAEEFGLEAGARGAVIALPALTSTLAAFNLGRITLVFSARYLVIVSSIGLAITFATMGLAGTLVLIAIAALIYGVSEGVLIPLLQDLAVEYAPAEHRAAVIAVWVAFVRLGQTVGPLLAGLLIGVVGTGATLVIGAAAAGLILLLGLAGPFPRARTPRLR